MKTMKTATAVLGLLLNAGVGIPAALADGPPATLMPARLDGAGLNAVNLESQKAWYEAKLGMTVISAAKAIDGSPREYIMGIGAEGTVVILRKWPIEQRPNAIGRIILNVPNARGLVDWLKTQGVDGSPMVANVSYSIADPEGNEIVLMTVAGAAAASAPAPMPTPNTRCGAGPTKSRLLDGAYRMMAQGNPYEVSTAQDMYRQGLAQQSQLDENYATCLRSSFAK